MSSPLQNRVAPDGTLHAVRARGLMMGNRCGKIHGPDKEIKRRWAGKAWISCVLQFKNRQREVMGPGYTELFFLDEMTAMTAGHRPCFECRRQDAVRFAHAWNRLRDLPERALVGEMDPVLHAERKTTQPARPIAEITPHQIVRVQDQFVLVLPKAHLSWSFSGYTPISLPPNTTATPLMPASMQAVVSCGYVPSLHPSALLHPTAPAEQRV